MKKIEDVSTALTLFESEAGKHAEATERGDYKQANKCYSSIIKVIAFLKEAGEIPALAQLLDHLSIGVRMWSATYLLPVLEDESRKTLEKIAESPGIHSLTAKTTLAEWEKGNLKR